MKQKLTKILAVVIAFFLIANIILFAAKKINELTFWIVIIAAAVFAYWILPKIKN